MFRKHLFLLFFVVVVFVGGAVSAESPHTQPQSQTFIVESSADLSDTDPGDGFCISFDGFCTLRAALEEANKTPTLDTIQFKPTTSFVFLPTSPLPEIVYPIYLDGITDNPSTCPTSTSAANLRITLSGVNAGADVDGLHLGDSADGSTIKGINIVNFEQYGINVGINSHNNTIICTQIGFANGTNLAMPNGTGIIVLGDNTRIGSTNAADRNVISGNIASGINLNVNAADTVVEGNYLGVNSNGDVALGNQWGVLMQGSDSVLGGTDAAAGNVISGNTQSGIDVGSIGRPSRNQFMYNKIGTDKTGMNPIPNGTFGINLRYRARANTVGTVIGAENIIAFNGSDGVRMADIETQDNSVRFNFIHSNGGLGINLDGVGEGVNQVTLNDSNDTDNGPNGLQNFPLIATANPSGLVTGSLPTQSGATQTYDIDVYQVSSCDASGHGEAHSYLGSFTLTGSGGIEAFSHTLTIAPTTGAYVTMLATNESGSTSEFSACRLVSNSTPTAITLNGQPAISSGQPSALWAIAVATILMMGTLAVCRSRTPFRKTTTQK